MNSPPLLRYMYHAFQGARPEPDQRPTNGQSAALPNAHKRRKWWLLMVKSLTQQWKWWLWPVGFPVMFSSMCTTTATEKRWLAQPWLSRWGRLFRPSSGGHPAPCWRPSSFYRCSCRPPWQAAVRVGQSGCPLELLENPQSHQLVDNPKELTLPQIQEKEKAEHESPLIHFRGGRGGWPLASALELAVSLSFPLVASNLQAKCQVQCHDRNSSSIAALSISNSWRQPGIHVSDVPYL